MPAGVVYINEQIPGSAGLYKVAYWSDDGTVSGNLTPMESGGVAPPLPTGAATDAKQDISNAVLGTTAGAAVIADADGTIQQYLRGLVVKMLALIARFPAALGTQTAANSLSVVPASDAAFSMMGFRPLVKKGAIPNTAISYVADASRNIGGVVTIATGLPAGTIIQAGTLRLKVRWADFTTPGNIGLYFFDANPSGSTLTNNAAISIAAADLAKAYPATGSWVNTANNGVVNSTITLPRITVDAGGNIYLAVYITAVNTFAAADALFYELDLLY